jgi:hypothetical protein
VENFAVTDQCQPESLPVLVLPYCERSFLDVRGRWIDPEPGQELRTARREDPSRAFIDVDRKEVPQFRGRRDRAVTIYRDADSESGSPENILSSLNRS